jgi:hypothetical protein
MFHNLNQQMPKCILTPVPKELMWDTKSNTYKKTHKIIMLYVLIFAFLDSRQDNKRPWTQQQ